MRAALVRCVAIKDTIQNNLEQNFAVTVYSVLVASIQVTNMKYWYMLFTFGGCFLDAQYNPLIILCSATNVAFAFSEWVRNKVVELFQDCARVDIFTI